MNQKEILQLGRIDLINFSILTDPRYKPNWHHLLIADYLERVERGEIKRLIIEMPPRSGKSQLASINFPAYYLGRNPDKEIITSSYSGDLASDFGQKTRDLVRDPIYQGIFPEIVLREDTQAKNKWMTESKGSYISVGVGGALTGRGSNCFIAGTLITTDRGKIPIEHCNNRTRVLSYNHDKNILETKPIKATIKRVKKRFIEITTTGGRRITSTDDHRFFVVGKGYIEAKKLKTKERFRILQVSQKSDCCLFSLPKRVLERLGRIHKEGKDWTKRFLLWRGVFGKAPFIQKQQKMSCLWKNSKKRKYILFKGMYSIFQEIKKYTLSLLQETNQTTFSFNKILFNGMQERLSFSGNAGEIKPKLQTWAFFEKISERISKEKIYSQERYKQGMYCLQEENKFSSTSSGLQPKKQQRREPSICLQELSCNSSQIKEDTISTITSFERELDVYDIEVEENHNFFANDILVHNCLLIDDPIKNREEANSETMRNKVWDWFTSTAFTRLSPGGAVIVIQTRWHQDDLAGRIQEMDEDNEWTLLSLPAIAEHDEKWNIKGVEYERKQGEALWQNRYPLEELLKIKKQVGIYDFNCLYQQNPINEENQVFKKEWFTYYEEYEIINKDLEVYAMVDLATWDKSDKNDNTSIQVIGKEHDSNIIYKLEDFTGRYNPTEIIDYLFYLKDKYKMSLIEVGIETNGYQKSLEFFLKQEMDKRGKPFSVKPIVSRTSKELRIRGLVPFYENRLIKHRSNGKDNALEDEMLVFPFGKHDDRIDSMALMLQTIEETDHKSSCKSFTPNYNKLY